jgi:cytochrome c oxidase cbb3-type subunit 3
VLQAGGGRFQRSCTPCHGEKAQGLIGPNLTDDRWIHGGKVEQVFQTVAKGWPAKGMPPWGRALKPEELAALVSYIRSIQGSNPPNPRAPEGDPVVPEPIPGR